MSSNLSDKLMPNLQKSAICYVLGNKRSGKSLLTLSILHRSLTRDYFHNYILVLPTYRYEQKGSYEWIDKVAKEKKKLGVNVYVMEEINIDAILNFLMKEKQKNEDHRTLVIFDDSTSDRSLFYSTSEKGSKILQFLSRIRHLNASLILIAHSAN